MLHKMAVTNCENGRVSLWILERIETRDTHGSLVAHELPPSGVEHQGEQCDPDNRRQKYEGCYFAYRLAPRPCTVITARRVDRSDSREGDCDEDCEMQ